MNIQTYPSGPIETNAYVVECPTTQEAAIIDPAPGSANAMINYLNKQKLTLEKILITHSHWDHIGDAAFLKNKYQVPVYIHALDAENLEKPGSDGLTLWSFVQGMKPDQLLKEGDYITIGSLQFEVIHTPGHTPGGVCFYCQEHQVLFSGDTLFKGCFGNLSFPTANPDLMWESLAKLANLPPETQVLSGHGLTTTIGAETWLSNAKKFFKQ